MSFFRPKVLSKFLMRRFFSGFLLVMLIICGIIFAVTFVERLPSNDTALAALLDSWIRLLEYLPMFLPLAVFMGTLLASYNLTKSSEGIIIAGTGLSPYQSYKPFFIGAFIIGILAATLVNPYSVNLSNQHLTKDQFKLIDGVIWLRESSNDGYITVKAKNVNTNKNDIVLKKASVFVQNQDFKLIERINADKLVLSNEGLKTKKATIINTKGIPTTNAWSKKTLITPQTVLERYLQPDQISFWKLPSFIHKMKEIGVPTRGHLIQFWTLLFLPLTMVAMTTLGVAFSQTKQRRNFSFGVKFSIGILTCFTVYIIVNLFNALASTGTLPPLLAIIAPQLIIIAGSGTAIKHFDVV